MLLLLISALFLGSCMPLLTIGYVAEADTNKDKSLSYEEFLVRNKQNESEVAKAKSLGLTDEEYAKQRFKKIDENKNGLITKEEMLKYFREGAQ